MGEQDEAWTTVQYIAALQKLQEWMVGVYMWIVVFLFPPGVYFEEAMRESMSLPSNCTWRKGVWVFQEETVPTHELDLCVGNEFQQSVQVIEDIAIVMVHPIATRAMENLHLHAYEQEPLVFTIYRFVDQRMDEVERTLVELKRLIDCYLLEKWGLVAVGITIALVKVMKNSFVDIQVIRFDGSTHQIQFLYNTLEAMHITRSGVGQTSRGEPSCSQQLGSMNKYDNVVDDIEVNSEHREDLHSKDTPVRDGLQVRGTEEDNLENDPIYVEGEQEVEETIEEVDKGNDSEEDNDGEEEMEDDTETEEDENDTSTDSLEEGEEISQEVKKNTQAKGLKRKIVNEGPSIDLGTLVARAPTIVENVAEREVHIPKIGDCAIKQVDIEIVEEVPMIVT